MSSASYDEIVAATYAGWVVGLNSEPQQKEAGPSVGAQEPISEEVQAKMDNLRCDIHWFDDIIQLSPEGEVNSGGYIPRREASRYISTALHRP